MSAIRNTVRLIGNVGNDPESVNLDNGKKVSRISLATNENYLKDGEKVQQTDWHNLVAWGRQAELIQNFVTKGKEVAIEGKLTSHSYEDKSGDKKYVTEIVIREILFLGSSEQ